MADGIVSTSFTVVDNMSEPIEKIIAKLEKLDEKVKASGQKIKELFDTKYNTNSSVSGTAGIPSGYSAQQVGGIPTSFTIKNGVVTVYNSTMSIANATIKGLDNVLRTALKARNHEMSTFKVSKAVLFITNGKWYGGNPFGAGTQRTRGGDNYTPKNELYGLSLPQKMVLQLPATPPIIQFTPQQMQGMTGLGQIMNSIKSMFSGIKTNLLNIFNSLKTRLGNLFSQKGNPLQGMINNFKGAAGNFTSRLFSLSGAIAATGFIITKVITFIGKTIGKIAEFTDDMSLSRSKLKLVSKDNDNYQNNKQLIKDAANSSYTGVVDFTNQVAKLQLSTNNSFGDTANAIKFVETLNKAFVIGGADETERRGATLQITQAIGSGRLQGDEFKSVLENAPLIAREVSKTLGIPFEKLKEYSSKGKISAEDLKRAVLDASDTIDKQFKKIPRTWAMTMQVFKNEFTAKMEKTMVFMQRLANSEKVLIFGKALMKILGTIIEMVTQVFSVFTTIIGNIMSIIGEVTGIGAAIVSMMDDTKTKTEQVNTTFSTLRKIVVGLVVAFLLYKTVLVLSKVAMVTYHVAAIAMTGIIWLLNVAIGASTTAVWANTAAWLANPITWIVIAIIAVIVGMVALIAVMMKGTDESATMGEKMVGAIYWIWAVVKNLGKFIWNCFIKLGGLIYGTVYALKNGFPAALKGFGASVMAVVDEVILGILKIARWGADIINEYLGTDLGSSINGYIKDYEKKVNEWKNIASEANAELTNKFNEGYNSFVQGKLLQYDDTSEAFDKGVAAAKSMKSWVSEALGGNLLEAFKLEDMMTGTNQLISQNGNKLDDINKSVKKEKKEWQEDIKLLTQLATRQAIINVTRPEVKVEATFNGTPTSIESKDIADTIADKISNTISAYANKGVN